MIIVCSFCGSVIDIAHDEYWHRYNPNHEFGKMNRYLCSVCVDNAMSEAEKEFL